MKLLDRLEKRLGGYALENTTLLLIAGQVVVFFAQYLQPNGAVDLIELMELNPQKVLAGEVWRLITFIFLAPLNKIAIFVFFFWYLFYLMGTALEAAWSVFKFNIFCGLSYFATVGAAFLAYAIAPGPNVVVADYLYGSIFLAFARLYPDFKLLLFFVLPVRVKWLATLQWLIWALAFAVACQSADWFRLLTIVAAVGNFFVFFGGDILRDIRHGHRRTVWRAKVLQNDKKVEHECRVCGLTSTMSPRTRFRYCSKCEGNACYCPDHLHNHEHITNAETGADGR